MHKVLISGPICALIIAAIQITFSSLLIHGILKQKTRFMIPHDGDVLGPDHSNPHLVADYRGECSCTSRYGSSSSSWSYSSPVLSSWRLTSFWSSVLTTLI
ncbi:hypothetical protein Pmani_038445 [Petrolisthes manimaculis]|uniref:Uncharacterized protein n=1 Tax=Petrolisthes manimaculis TaxID=1843537 RepID=A0AAE1TKD5_9EUCA|nr:hypothetical protein Pmani_038445 [Petrolisthes manimaculis]